jgi:hypothetical protein
MTFNEQTISVELPEPIFRRLRRVAEITHRSVEDVLAATVDAALPQTPDVPVDVADDLAAMVLLSDKALWTAVETTLPTEQQHRLTKLSQEGEARLLTGAEAVELTHLIDAYDRAVLRRAKALAILGQRGYDISARVEQQLPMDDGAYPPRD